MRNAGNYNNNKNNKYNKQRQENTINTDDVKSVTHKYCNEKGRLPPSITENLFAILAMLLTHMSAINELWSYVPGNLVCNSVVSELNNCFHTNSVYKQNVTRQSKMHGTAISTTKWRTKHTKKNPTRIGFTWQQRNVNNRTSFLDTNTRRRQISRIRNRNTYRNPHDE